MFHSISNPIFFPQSILYYRQKISKSALFCSLKNRNKTISMCRHRTLLSSGRILYRESASYRSQHTMISSSLQPGAHEDLYQNCQRCNWERHTRLQPKSCLHRGNKVYLFSKNVADHVFDFYFETTRSNVKRQTRNTNFHGFLCAGPPVASMVTFWTA